MSTDAELLRQYAEHKSEPAFTALVERHVGVVYSAALRQLEGDAHRAQDVVQVVFTLLAQKAGSLVRHPALVGWLYTTTYHAADKVRRAEQRRARLAQRLQLMTEPIGETNSEADWDHLRPLLDGVMVMLQERDRTAILLRFFANQSFCDIGEQLGLSENAARMRVDRALDAIRAALARRGVTSTSAALATMLAGHAVAATPPGLAAAVSAGALNASAGSGFALLMSSTLIKTAALVGVVALGSFGWYHQHRLAAENARLRTELMTAHAQVATLRAAASMRSIDRASPTSPATSDPAPLLSAPAPRPPGAAGGMTAAPDVEKQLTRVSDLRNVGRRTPVASIQTILWAIEHGDESLPDMLFLNKGTLHDAEQLMAALPSSVREKYEKPEKLAALYLSKQVLDYVETVQVQGVKQLDPETVEVTILTGERGPAIVSMQWTPNGWLWKVKPSVIAAARLDLLGPPTKENPKP